MNDKYVNFDFLAHIKNNTHIKPPIVLFSHTVLHLFVIDSMNTLRHYADATTLEYGVDEVARGCLFGRVYAGAVVWKSPSELPDDPHEPIELPKGIVIRDSKTMSKAQRERAEVWIRQNAYAVQIAYKDETYIDAHNILVAAQEAMCEALRKAQCEVLEKQPNNNNNTHSTHPQTPVVEHALVDGNTFRPLTPSPMHHTCVVKGDSKYFSIACAAIVAKVAHDNYISHLCIQFPVLNERYDLCNNMGYGTKKHKEGIQTYGITNLHRRSFGCCQNSTLAYSIEE